MTENRRRILVLVLLTLVALALRAHRLDAVGLSEDESHKVQAARAYRAGDFVVNAEHPMLMKKLVTVSLIAAERWNQAFASSRPTFTISEETALRLPNALFGALTTIVLFLFAREMFDPLIGWITAALWATGINAIAINRIAKEDTLLVFFVWLGYYFFLKAKHEGPVETARRDRLYTLSGASFGLMVASKYFPHYMGLYALYNYLRPHDPPTNYPLGKRAVTKFFIAFFLAFLLVNPAVLNPDTLRYMLVYVSEQTVPHHGYQMMNHLYYNNAWKWTHRMPGYFYLLFLLVKAPPILIPAFIIGLVLIIRGLRNDGTLFLRFMLAFWIVPFSLLVGGKYLRYTLSLMPLVYMTAALGIAAVYRKLKSLQFHPQARLVAVNAVLAIFLLVPAGTALANRPYYALYVSALGGGKDRRAYYFPHDEIYDTGMREAIEFIASRAPSGSIVAQDAPGVVEFYARKFQRADLVAVELSSRHFDLAWQSARQLTHDGQRILPDDPIYIIVQTGRRYFENQAWLDYIEQHYQPVKEVWVDGVRTTRVYEIRDDEILPLGFPAGSVSQTGCLGHV